MLDKLMGYCAGMVLGAAVVMVTMPVIFAHKPVSPPSKMELWNDIQEFSLSSSLYKELQGNDWISESVSYTEFDQILVTVQQLSENSFENVPVPLALAVISVESNFRSDCESPAGAVGLMQVIPKWHVSRAAQYTDTKKIDLTDTFLNIATGMDYLNEILEETEGDVTYALMWYNMGAKTATKKYAVYGETSVYAQMVVERAEYLSQVIESYVPKPVTRQYRAEEK